MSTATDMLAAYLQAEAALLQGKAFSLGGKMLTREDLAEIRRGRAEWEERVALETSATGTKPSRGPIYLELPR